MGHAPGVFFYPTIRGSLCTAVGLNLSNYSAPPQMTPKLFVEPMVEVSFYADEIFPRFSISAPRIAFEIGWIYSWIGGTTIRSS